MVGGLRWAVVAPLGHADVLKWDENSGPEMRRQIWVQVSAQARKRVPERRMRREQVVAVVGEKRRMVAYALGRAAVAVR